MGLRPLGSIVQRVVADAIDEKVSDTADQKVLNIKPETGSRGKLMATHSWNRIGRYVRIPGEKGAGAWFGIHFGHWKSHGVTPLWLVFADTDFGQGPAVAKLLKPWADDNKMLTATNDGEFAIGLDFPVNEEEDRVAHLLVEELKKIAGALAPLPPNDSACGVPEADEDVT